MTQIKLAVLKEVSRLDNQQKEEEKPLLMVEKVPQVFNPSSLPASKDDKNNALKGYKQVKLMRREREARR